MCRWFTCGPLWNFIWATSLIGCQYTKQHHHRPLTKMSKYCKNNLRTHSDKVEKFTSITRTLFLLFYFLFFAHSCMHSSAFPRKPAERETSRNTHASLYSREDLHLNSVSCHPFVGLGVERPSMGFKGHNAHHSVSLCRASMLPYPGMILLWKRTFSGNSWQAFLAFKYLIRILNSLE